MATTDKSPREADTAAAPHKAGPAEISNFEIVTHYFETAADRLEIDDDVRAVLRSAYREVQVQIPVSLSDGRIHVYWATGSSTTARAACTRAASATTPRSTSTRCVRWPR